MGTLNKDQVRKFIQQFPFLRDIEQIRPALDQPKHFRLQIKVQVADGEMLFNEPLFCLPPRLISTRDQKFVGHLRPSCYVVRKDGIRSDWWDYDHCDHFIKKLVWPGEGVDAVVLVEKYEMYDYIEDWYARGLGTGMGGFALHDWRVTIYKAPKQGFAKLIADSHLDGNVRITNLYSLGDLARAGDPEAMRASRRLDDLIAAFKRYVAPELWKKVKRCRKEGLAGEYGATQMLVGISGGRVMITFRRGPDQFSVAALDNSYEGMGQDSIDCSVDAAYSMVYEVINNWKVVKLLPDADVLPG